LKEFLFLFFPFPAKARKRFCLSISFGRIEQQVKNAGLRRGNAPFIAGSFTISRKDQEYGAGGTCAPG